MLHTTPHPPLLLLLLHLLLGSLLPLASAICAGPPPATSAAPTFSPSGPWTGALPSGGLVDRDKNTELVKLAYADLSVAAVKAANVQSACPFSEAGLVRWEEAASWGGSGAVPVAGQDVTLPVGVKMLASSCSFAASSASGPYASITVPATR